MYMNDIDSAELSGLKKLAKKAVKVVKKTVTAPVKIIKNVPAVAKETFTELKDSLKSGNFKDFGVRAGALFDPLNYVAPKAYRKITTAIPDAVNKGLHPLVKASLKLDPVNRTLAKKSKTVRKINKFADHKPGSIIGAVIGGAAAAGAIAGSGGAAGAGAGTGAGTTAASAGAGSAGTGTGASAAGAEVVKQVKKKLGKKVLNETGAAVARVASGGGGSSGPFVPESDHQADAPETKDTATNWPIILGGAALAAAMLAL